MIDYDTLYDTSGPFWDIMFLADEARSVVQSKKPNDLRGSLGLFSENDYALRLTDE
jgi:hypothetical protein